MEVLMIFEYWDGNLLKESGHVVDRSQHGSAVNE
jgi:hypothetical protein